MRDFKRGAFYWHTNYTDTLIRFEWKKSIQSGRTGSVAVLEPVLYDNLGLMSERLQREKEKYGF